jgi:regulator of sigma E protease
MNLADLPSTLLAFLLAIALLVTVHEFGHYWVARRCGVRVLRFSLGLGRPFWSRVDRHGTEWALAPIPLGGYVSMLDEREAAVPPALRGQAFNTRPVAQRIAIVLAGPLANLLLAVLLYTGLAMLGGSVRLAQLEPPAAGSPAAAAGLRGGERIVAVDGRDASGWGDVRWHLMRRIAAGDAAVAVTVEDGAGARTVRIDASAVSMAAVGGDLPAALGLRVEPPVLTLVVEGLAAGGAGAAAGLRAGDRVLAVDGVPLSTWDAFAARVRGSPGQELSVAVERDGRRLDLRVTPAAETRGGATVGRIGLSPRADAAWTARHITQHREPLFAALADATLRTWDTSLFSLRMLGGMLSGEVSPSNLSGPVAIADFAGQSARLGWLSFVGFLALMSISLGVLNLLPVPVLDGGHIMYHLIESVTGRPLSPRLMEIGQRVGIAALATLMLVAFYNDIQRILAG